MTPHGARLRLPFPGRLFEDPAQLGPLLGGQLARVPSWLRLILCRIVIDRLHAGPVEDRDRRHIRHPLVCGVHERDQPPHGVRACLGREAAALVIERAAPQLSEGRPGLLGGLTARAEAQVVRLALIYALLDGRGEIGIHHLRAALALWEYADASTRYLWGDALSDPVADEILRALRQAGPAGRTRTELRDLFGRHRGAEEIGRVLAALAAAGKARRVIRADTGGRPGELWVAEGV
jgi:hypothetical protein